MTRSSHLIERIEPLEVHGLGIAIADASQLAWVVLGGIEAVKGDGLVADESRVAIHRRRIQAPCIEVLLGAGDEEASHLIERIEPLEVQVTPIHDVEGTGLDKQQVQHIDVVHLAVGDVDLYWSIMRLGRDHILMRDAFLTLRAT